MNHLTDALDILSDETFGESLSGTLHKIQCAEACILSALCGALEAANVPWEDYTSDYYDNSLELLGVGEWIPSAEQLDAIWSLGFARLWTNPGVTKHSPGEKHYVKGIP